MIRQREGRYLTAIVIGVVTLLGAWAAAAPTALAASAAPAATSRPHASAGVSIAPAFQQITVGQNDTEKTFDFTIKNNTSTPLEFSVSAVDFGSLDESGGVLFMGQTDKSLNYKYGLAQYVTLQQDRVVAEANSTVKIPVTITNKQSLSPGGHYGAILVTPTQTGDDRSKVQVNEVISSLLFVTKQGGEIYNMALQSYELKTRLFSAPSSVDMRFQNAGNVHVIPRGMITITDPRGRAVQEGFINEGSAIILPESFRKLSVPLKGMQAAWWPGVYHMRIAYRFDGEETDHIKSMSFLYVNGWYVLAGMALLALGIVAIIFRPVRRWFGRLYQKLSWPFRWIFGLVGRRFFRR